MKKLELHQKTIMSVLKDAYDLGKEDAMNKFSEENFKIEDVIKDWLEFIRKFDEVYSDYGIRYSDGENIYILDDMIRGFKLSYGY